VNERPSVAQSSIVPRSSRAVRAILALLTGAVAGTCALPVAAVHAAAFPISVRHQWPIGRPGIPGGLIVAPDGGHAYLGVGRAIVAYDAVSLATTASIRLPGTVEDLTIAADGVRAYAALRDVNAIALLGLDPLRLLGTWRLRYAPSALLLDPTTGSLYVQSAAAHRLSELDATTGRVRAHLRLAGRLQQMAANGYGALFVAVADRDAVDVVDTRTLRLTGAYPVRRCAGPSGLALDPVGRRLFVACRSGGVAVIDTDIGFTFESLPGPPGASRGVFVRSPTGVDGWKGAAFFATRRGVLHAVRMFAFIRYAGGGRLLLPRGGAAMAFDPRRHRLWLATVPADGSGATGSLLILGAAAPARAPAPATGVRP